MDRYVKFYSPHDLSNGINLEEAFKIVTNINPSKQRFNINEIIELYNISLFIKNKMYLTRWNLQEKDNFNKSMPTLLKRINVYFSDIKKNNFQQKTKNLKRYYYDDFIILFGCYDLASKISESQFSKFVEKKQIHLRILLKSKYIVEKYPEYLKTSILQNSLNAEILLDKYISDSESKLIIPSIITDEEKSILIDQYLDNPSANYNFIKQIKNVSNEKNALDLSDKIKLKAKRREIAEAAKIFDNGSGIKLSYEIGINENQEEEIIKEDTGDLIKRSFGFKWLKNHLDYNTVLNNFIYLFEYVDSNMRIDLISHISEQGVFERHLGVKSKKDYKKGFAFDIKETISTLEMVVYFNFLRTQNRSIEKAIEWFFHKYLSEEFSAVDFKITMPNQQTTFEEKCHKAISEMEKVIKEFDLYVENGEIDYELLRISSNQVNYSMIPSLLKNKYVYSVDNNPNLNFMLNALFSDQSGLSYINENKNSSNLFELIKEHDVILYSDFPEYNHAAINELIQMKLLKVQNDKVDFDNVPRILVLLNIFQSGFIEYQRIHTALQDEIEKMKKEGLLETESTLLSKQEADYFDYYLNMKKFTNGPNIRNQYSHGTQPSSEDEQAHFNNYMIILKLFILIVIKINDEFCLVVDQKNNA